MAPKPFRVCVTTVESELNYIMDGKTVGKELFDQVAKNIGLRELWFFGLEYTDHKSVNVWLKMDKQVLAQYVQRDSQQPLQFRFLARYFPEDVSEELIQEITQRLFYRQIKQSILDDQIYCPPETCVLLASYAMQVKFGDFDESKHRPGVLTSTRLLPQRVSNQFDLSNTDWEVRVVNWWKEHQGLTTGEAMMEYLKIVQDLDMYGITYFEIQNKRGTNLLLGVDALGINIYETNNKLTPKIGFLWKEIRDVSYDEKKFIIKPDDRQSSEFVFIASRIRINRQILALCMGNHELYERRRLPNTNEVLQLKAQAAADKRALNEERERIRAEIERREQAEQELETSKRQIDNLEQSIQLIRQGPLSRRSSKSSDTISIEEQNEQAKVKDQQRQIAEEAQMRLQREKSEADRQHKKRMEETRQEQVEKDKMVQEIEKTRSLAEENAQEAQRKENESRQIEEDLRETLAIIKQAKKTYDNYYNTPSEQHSETNNDYASSDEKDSNATRAKQKVDPPRIQNTTNAEENRIPVLSRNNDKKKKLENERRELFGRRQTSETHEDKIYRENIVDKGVDKYKTLKKIREGTVKRRIDEFEAM